MTISSHFTKKIY